MTRKFGWQVWVWPSVLVLALALMIRGDLRHLEWVSQLSTEGSPAPQQSPDSTTGYVLGQRHFLGFHERGETYRWIAATQDLIVRGPFASSAYSADNVPEGRPQLIPKLYTVWLATISWGLHWVGGEPISVAVEQAALWEPVLSHILVFVAVAAFMWTRFGWASASAAGFFFVLFPAISGQFLPGCLSPRTWALFFAAYAIALNLPPNGDRQKQLALSVCSALSASLALWLDPAFGFPSVLISAAASAVTLPDQNTQQPWLKWSLIGSGVTLMAWLVDQAPWNPAPGELRYVHPFYALAWLGIGLGLNGCQNLRAAKGNRKRSIAEIVVAIPLVALLVHTQIKEGYKGWLYTGAAMRRLTSLDETTVFNHITDWLSNVSTVEIFVVAAPALAATLMIALSFARRREAQEKAKPCSWSVVVLFVGLLAFTFFKVRWVVIGSLVALPLVWHFAWHMAVAHRRILLACFVIFLIGLSTWNRNLPASLKIPSGADKAGPTDVEMLLYRHCSHWIASHNPGQKISALTPPELSDSLVFHGGCRVLMSTAWESFPGQVAASRVLSAPESSEAEAMLQGREITHVVLPSWDKVLPLLVHQMDGKETLYSRLQRWVYPRYLRPIPYHLPPTPGYLDQKLVVFKVIPAEDEALSLSRLAEYFVEMERDEPAGLVAQVLAESYPDDPNAAIARAVVYAQGKKQTEFEKELARLVAAVKTGQSPIIWDRRVQRAIVLALGRRHDLAREEIAACLTGVSADEVSDLTPLQAHRLRTLAKGYGLAFSDPNLADRLASLGAEYSTASSSALPAR